MNLDYVLDPGIPEPSRAHETDAGIDLSITERVAIPVGGHRKAHTGLHVAIPQGHVGMVFVRSSIGIKHHLVLSNGTGIIDAGYTGEIILSLHNTGHKHTALHPGQRVAQLVILPVSTPHLNRVNTLTETPRGDGGIGSTGK